MATISDTMLGKCFDSAGETVLMIYKSGKAYISSSTVDGRWNNTDGSLRALQYGRGALQDLQADFFLARTLQHGVAKVTTTTLMEGFGSSAGTILSISKAGTMYNSPCIIDDSVFNIDLANQGNTIW